MIRILNTGKYKSKLGVYPQPHFRLIQFFTRKESIKFFGELYRQIFNAYISSSTS